MSYQSSDSKYQTEINKEIWSFIKATKRFYSTDISHQSLAIQRQEYDQMCNAFRLPNPPGLSIETTLWEDISVRIYTPPNPKGVMVYYHGGGFVVGGLESHDDVCAEFAVKTDLRVVSADYRLAPEHKHPAQFLDALCVAKNAFAHFKTPLILAGDSAGGNLAAAVCHALRCGDISCHGQLLIYPALGTQVDAPSYHIHANAPLLTIKDMEYYLQIRCDGCIPHNDATFAPLNDTDFSNLPPTVIFSAACDPLADDGPLYQDAILKAGGKAHCFTEAGLVHGYLRARKAARPAKQSFERMITAAKSMAKGQWPY